jgi:cytochrome c biogenesis protein CcdA
MMILTILWLALIDSINPHEIALAITILLYTGAKGVWGFIHGVFLTTLAQLLFLYFGMIKLLELISDKNLPHVSGILILIGIAITAYGWHLWQHRFKIPTVATEKIVSSFNYSSYLKFFLLGSFTILAGTPGSFLLVFAVIEVKKLEVSTIFVLVYFGLYALIYTLPMIALNLAAIWQEKRLKRWLNCRLNWFYLRLNMVISLSLIVLGIVCFVMGILQL